MSHKYFDYQIGKYYQANYSYDTYNHSYYQQSTFDTLGQYRLLTISSNGTDHIHNGYIYCFHKYTIHNVKANLSKFILVIVFGSWAVKRTIENIDHKEHELLVFRKPLSMKNH